MTSTRLEALYRMVEGQTSAFLEAVTRAAAAAHNEREFQTKVTRSIEDFAQKVGVDLLFREEYTLATGRADAVYNRLVIEYERPGSMRRDLKHSHTAHAVKQIRQYVEDVAKREKHDRDRLLGVAWDGMVMIFARYRDGHWHVEPPLEVNTQSIARLLRSLVSLSSGRALIPDNLVQDFGAQSVFSQRAAQALYHALEGHRDDLAANLYRQWQSFFGQVSGYEKATSRLRDKKELRLFAQGMGLRPEATDPGRLFFAVHTYFSFLVKAIARLVLGRYAGGHLGATPLTVLANLQGDALKTELERLEDGGVFRVLGLTNLLEGDFFSWYLQAWSTNVEEALRLALSRLAEYNPATIEEDPFAARDLLKKLYHYLLPRELRHDLGEYYTPDWLAERVLTQLMEPLYVYPNVDQQPATLFPPRRVLDPACGSGTFLIVTIRAIKEHCARQGLAEADTLEYILDNVVGVDLNPLAVMAARVNYLLAIAELIPYRRKPITVPIYLADSILTPTEGANLFEQGQRRLNTVVGSLPVPQVITTATAISKLTELLDEYVSNQFSTDAFVERASRDLGIVTRSLDETILRELYEKLLDLERRKLDGIWARVLKNAFMPLFIGQFDYVAGNPPWVNWESLPDGYRQQTKTLWQDYGLYHYEGLGTILGTAKKDISTLMTCVAMDRYLKPNGKLAFVITQSVFKTSGAAQGFRKFRLPGNVPFRVTHVDDMSELQPFEGASNRTSVMVLQKGQATRYPVPYTYWRKAVKGKGINYDSNLDEVFAMVRRMELSAQPVSDGDHTSPWITARPQALKAIRRALGRSDYEAHAGLYTGGANGVYWLEALGERPDGLVIVRNLAEHAKREVDSVTAEVEPDLVYPLLRGRDVQRWRAQPSAYTLLPHTLATGWKAMEVAEMERAYPKSYAYLRNFEDVLLQRRSGWYQKAKDRLPFYICFSVGDHTFAPYKVVWRYIATEFICSVVLPTHDSVVGTKVPIPDHRLMIVACDSPDEAYYLASVLNSCVSRLVVQMYMIGTQISTHVVQRVAIPKFAPDDQVHRELARLGRLATESGDCDSVQLGERIDSAVAMLWSITASELAVIRRNLHEVLGTATEANQETDP